jgi:hypothetical protein
MCGRYTLRTNLNRILAASFLWPALMTIAVISATAIQLHWQGRPWWCRCGQWLPWSRDAWGPHNSQHFVDPYSLTHVQHGLLLCVILAVAAPRLTQGRRFVLAVGLECGWEVFENTAFVINRFRAATAALGYEGDSIANSVGDILSCVCGYWLAGRLGWRWATGMLFAIEVLLLLWIRDSLVLNVVMLVCPIETIRAWQTGT